MKTLGWIATFMSVMMHVSYIPQIMDNFSGQKGNFIQPLVAAINCSLWVYGLLWALQERARHPTCCSKRTGDFIWLSSGFDSLAIKEDKTKLTC